MFTINEFHVLIHSLSKIYKKMAPLIQERSHCIRNWIYLFTIFSL